MVSILTMLVGFEIDASVETGVFCLLRFFLILRCIPLYRFTFGDDLVGGWLLAIGMVSIFTMLVGFKIAALVETGVFYPLRFFLILGYNLLYCFTFGDDLVGGW